jgi:hypothetical protein
MADATATQTTTSPRIIRVEMPRRPLRVPPAPTPLPVLEEAIQAQRDPHPIPFSLDPRKTHAALAAKRQHWASLNLRQEWADTAFMRGHLKVAGVKVGASTEPATVQRMKAKLRAVGIHSPEIQEAIGMTLGRFLESNPRLPLWAALALVLESIGRFTPDGFEGGAE